MKYKRNLSKGSNLVYKKKEKPPIDSSLITFTKTKKNYLFYFIDNCFKRIRIIHCQIGKNFPIDFNIVLV